MDMSNPSMRPTFNGTEVIDDALGVVSDWALEDDAATTLH